MKAIVKQMSILLSVMMIIGVFTIVPVGAAAAVSYVDRTWDADEKKIVETSTTTTDYTSLSSSITELRSGKYVLDSDVTYSKSLKVKSGASAELILVNGKTLKNDKGIIVPQNATLTIYGQAASGDVKADSGIVDAYNPDGAAIGAMDEEKTGSIIIKATPHNSRRTACLNIIPSVCPKNLSAQSAHLNYAVLPIITERE